MWQLKSVTAAKVVEMAIATAFGPTPRVALYKASVDVTEASYWTCPRFLVRFLVMQVILKQSTQMQL